MKLNRENTEIFSQQHQMYAEGAEDKQMTEKDVFDFLYTLGWQSTGSIEIFYDDMQGVWRWIANQIAHPKPKEFIPCGKGVNICKCKDESECGYTQEQQSAEEITDQIIGNENLSYEDCHNLIRDYARKCVEADRKQIIKKCTELKKHDCFECGGIDYVEADRKAIKDLPIALL